MMAKKTAKKKTVKKKFDLGKWKAAPLKGSFMITSILGFLLSGYYVYPQSFNLGVASMLVFAIMFVASLISMTKAPVINEKL
jgi:hypothetical protein